MFHQTRLKKIKRFMPLILVAFIINCSPKSIIKGDYYFLMKDGEVMKIAKHNDTIMQYKCYVDRACIAEPERYYKLLDFTKRENKYMAKVKRISKSSYTGSIISTLLFQRIDAKRIIFFGEIFDSAKNNFDVHFVDTLTTNNKFGLTFFSKNYYNNLSKLRTLTTKADIDTVISLMKSEKYLNFIRLYDIKAFPGDLYASSLMAELLNRACIEKGYNPIGASKVIKKLMHN